MVNGWLRSCVPGGVATAAKALGLAIPSSMLVGADEVID
jgi:hypothetical protein